jgi:uncharacterized protein YcgI (DUF1989 family)
MQTGLATLSPLARVAVPATSASYAPELELWAETLPGGMHWSGLLRRGNTLRITDVQGRANLSALFFNCDDRSERYSMPDTLKAQHTAFLTRGNVCFSDMGRVLCSIPVDNCGWHDTVCGVLDGVHLISVQKVTVRACPENEHWRGVC